MVADTLQAALAAGISWDDFWRQRPIDTFVILIAHRRRIRTQQEISITGAFYTEWFARQKQISGKTLADVLGYGYDHTKHEKSDEEIGASALLWAGGEPEPLDLSDMNVETYDDGT